MAEGAGRLLRVVWITEHARELQPDLNFHVDGDRRGVLAHVVGVVRQGQYLCGQAGQQQIRHHVAHVTRTVKRH